MKWHMKQNISLLIICGFLSLISTVLISEPVVGAQSPDVSIVVTRTQAEELSPDRMFDLVFLTSRTLYHTLDAARQLQKGKRDDAGKSLNMALNLAGMLDKILPEVSVDMTITDSEGDKIGDHQVVRVNEIPIFQWMTNVKVVVPVVSYRNRLLKKDGLPQVNVTPESQFWVDVDYLTQSLREASHLMKASDDAKIQDVLDDALVSSVRVSTSPYGKDLKPAIHALLQAYWQCESKQYEKAGKSIAKARKQLQRYIHNEDIDDDPDLMQLIADLKEMESSVKALKSEKIKQCWFKVLRQKYPEL